MKATRFLMYFTVLAALLCAVTLCCTSCYQAPPTMIDPVDDPAGNPAVTTTTAEEVYVTRPTVAVPEAQLTLNDLIELHDVAMPWSSLEGYSHEMTGDNTARFTVSDGYGAECSLDVVIDYDSGLLTEATLTYGDVSESILTQSVQGISRIMLLMGKV